MQKDLSHLIKKRVQVTRGGKTFYQTVYVSPEDQKEVETPVGGEIVDFEGVKIDKYSDKSVLISGNTYKHLETLKELKNQLGIGSWNQSLKGWVFPIVHKDTILGKFASILGKEIEEEKNEDKKEHLEVELHNTKQEKNSIPVNTDVKTPIGKGKITDYNNGHYEITLESGRVVKDLEEKEFEIIPCDTKKAEEIINNVTEENRFVAEKELVGKPILTEKEEEKEIYVFKQENLDIETPSGEKLSVIDFSKALPKYIIDIPSEEDILNVQKPSWIADVNEFAFKSRGCVFNYVQLEEDKFLVQTHGSTFGPDADKKHITTNLDGLVVLHEYYRRKLQAINDTEANKKGQTSVERWKNMPDDKLITANATKKQYVEKIKFSQLSKTEQKKVGSEEKWNEMSYEDKKEAFNPYQTSFRGKKIKILKYGSINKDNFDSYKKFVDKEYQPQYKGGYYTPDKFTVEFNKTAELIQQKVKDIEIQREEMTQQYQKALETSYGNSNIENDLKESHGVFIKKQDGKKLTFEEKQQIQKGLDSIKSLFGDRKSMNDKFGLKVIHSGEKQMFAAKAVGLYSPKNKSISVSAKHGDSQFGFTMAHEYAHFMDNYAGDKNGRRFASDDYTSTAGKIASEFRNNMNKPPQSDYVGRTCECFARAFEQYFAHKTEGVTATRFGKQTYSENEEHVRYDKFISNIAPLIEQFIKENDTILKSVNFIFDEESYIQDLMKAQLNTDPSHGGKLVKKQITDKTGKKTTKWVSKQEAEQIDKQGGQEKQQDPNESIKFIDSLSVEEKAKLELIKEHIDSGDMETAKGLASKLSEEAKNFIPKDAWKDIHGHKEEDKKEVKKDIVKEEKVNDLTGKFIKANEVETGKPVKISFGHNTEKANIKFGKQFGQYIEPQGKYITNNPGDFKVKGWEYGEIEFKNPLVLEHVSTTESGWKGELVNKFGKKGKELTKELIKRGYDGIITKDSSYNSLEEIVSLKDFDPNYKDKRKDIKKEEEKFKAISVKDKNMSELLFDQYNDNVEKLSEDQVASLNEYRDTAYYNINRELRNGNESDLNDEEQLIVKDIDSSFMESKHDMELFRGVANKVPERLKFFDDLKEGDEFQDKGYVSTSILEDSANKFLDKVPQGFNNKNFIIKINVKKGSKVIPMHNIGSEDIKDMYKDENEFLLPRDSKFRVVSKKGNVINIELI